MYEALEEIGLSKNESKVYISLLEIGINSAGKIAKEADLDRTNVYDVLDKLKNKGLVSYVIKDGTKHFQAADPRILRTLLSEKERGLSTIMPQLKLLKNMTENKNETQTYEGLSAFTNILDNFLSYNDQILVYGIPAIAPEMVRFFIPHFHRKRIPMNIVMKHIYNYNAQDRIAYLNTLEHTEAKYLPKEFDSPVSTFICGDEVVMVLWEKKPITIRIINKQISEVYKKYFEILWREAKI
ncbi:MAG: helix-turn-helix domain-containing protein [archaeon]